MVRSIVENSLNADNGICCKRSPSYGFSDTLLNSREEVLGNRTADNFLIEYILLFRIIGRTELHLNMSVLSVSAGLRLILGLDIGCSADSLSVCNLRC